MHGHYLFCGLTLFLPHMMTFDGDDLCILFLCYQLQILKGELQCENKLISYEKEFKMLENDMCITVISQAIPKLLIKL